MTTNKLHEDDPSVQHIAEFLWQTWNNKTLADQIQLHFPHDDRKLIEKVADRIGNLHCSGDGYDISDLIYYLEKLL